MAKGVWMASTKKERALLGASHAKWNHFTIDADSGAADPANVFQFQPAASGNDIVSTEVATDETQVESQTKASRVADSTDDDVYYTFSIGPADTVADPKSLNIFDQYLLSKQITAPADTRGGPYESIFGVEHEEMEQLQQSGDLPPWDADAFPSPWVLADSVSAELNPAHQGRTLSKMITAPLGLMLVKMTDHTGDDVDFQAFADSSGEVSNLGTQLLVHFKSGSYKGVHAPVYRAMKLPASTSP